MDFVAVGGVRGEHLAGDLGVAGLVGADQAELRSAEVGDEAEEEEVGGDGDEDDELPRAVRGRVPGPKRMQRRSRCWNAERGEERPADRGESGWSVSAKIMSGAAVEECRSGLRDSVISAAEPRGR